MKKYFSALVSSLLIISCSKTPDNTILGKWELIDSTKTGSIEFVKNGTWIIDDKIAGDYKFIDEKRISVQSKGATPFFTFNVCFVFVDDSTLKIVQAENTLRFIRYNDEGVKNRKGVIRDIDSLSSIAYKYYMAYLKNFYLRGKGSSMFSFSGFEIPSKYINTINGNYSAIAEDNKIVIIGIGNIMGWDKKNKIRVEKIIVGEPYSRSLRIIN